MSQEWYYADAARQQHGPVDAGQLEQLLRSGAIGPRSLVWRNGMGAWQALATLEAELPFVAAARSHVGSPPPMAPPAPPSDPYAAPRAAVASQSGVVQGGFGRRFLAYLLDGIVLLFVMGALFGIAASVVVASNGESDAAAGLLALMYFGMYFVQASYFAWMEASPWQATFGKRALGIKVTDRDGQRIGVLRGYGRWLAAGLNYLSFYIGYLMIAFTQDRRGLHDLVAGTQVVDRWAYTDQPERQRSGDGGGASVVVVVLIAGIVGIMVLGVLAAIAIPAYQDYVQRSKIAELTGQANTYKLSIGEHLKEFGACPESLEAIGLPPLQHSMVSQTWAGTFEDGTCGFQFTLSGGGTNFDGKQLWFWLENEEWRCGSDINARYLPSSMCR